MIKRIPEFHTFIGHIFNNQNEMRSYLLQLIYGKSDCKSNVSSISDKVLSSEYFGNKLSESDTNPQLACKSRYLCFERVIRL